MAVKPTFDEARGWDSFFGKKEVGENLCQKGTRQTSRATVSVKKSALKALFNEFHSVKKRISNTR